MAGGRFAGQVPRVTEILILSVAATGVAFAAGVAAIVLYRLIAVFTNLFFYGRLSWTFVDPAGGAGANLPWVLVIPAVGGLLVALMVRYGSEKISGHGIPEAMEAVLTGRSKIQPRVGLLKPISAAVAIGSGGPFGAEGPIIQTGGAIGSLLGQALRSTASERRTLLAAGAAAGMAATFGTPIAAVLLVLELLLFEFRPRSFIPVAIASGIGALLHAVLFAPGYLFPLPPGTTFGGLGELPLFAVLGLLCGGFASLLTKALYRLEDVLVALPLKKFWLPVIGGLAVGVIGAAVPHVLGVGYDTVQGILDNPAFWVAAFLLALLAAKSVAWIIALSSGSSGGVLAPMFMVGGAFGGLFGVTVKALIPGLAVSPAAFALVGMAAVFGSASRATFASIVFAAEVSGAFQGLVALVIGSVVADAVAILLLGDTTIMTEKLARRGLRVRHEYETNLLDLVPVSQVMSRSPRAVPPAMPASLLLTRMTDPSRPEYALRSFPIVDGGRRVIGVVTRNDLGRAPADPGRRTVMDIGSREPITVRGDDPCSTALERMVMRDVGHLPVVDDDGKLVGYVSRGDLLRAWRGRIAEESERELGFRFRWPSRRTARRADPKPPQASG